MTQRLSWLMAGLLAALLLTQPAVAGDKVAAQAAASESQGSAAQAVLNLDDLVREVVAKNPGVQSALHTYRAKLHRVPQVQALPDPKVAVGWMGNIEPFSVQTGDPSSYRDIQAMQEIPFPGKLGLRGDIAGEEAKAAWWEYEAARRQVVEQVKTAYYQYYFLAKAIDITQKNKDLLEKLSEIAEARYRVGKGIQQDVLKSQTELSLLLQRLTVLRQQRDTAQARINTLLARNPDAPLGPPAEVQPAVLGFSLDELYRLAAQNDTGLRREQQVVERNQYAVSLAHKDYLPDFGVGYMYQQRPILPDMHGFTFTVNVPVFYKSKQREAEQEAAEGVIAAGKARDNRQNEVNFDVKQAYLAAKASEDLAQLYAKAVVPQASLALESSMSSYQVGNVDFLNVLSNFSNVLDYQIEYYREVAEFQTALAQLEPLVGVELTGIAGTSPAVTPEPK
jgi:outer membrane protein, heavy metal efflux system